MAIYPVILAGGSGTRLWPLSSPDNPKQFSFLFGEQSLYQQTIQRISNMDELSDPIVTCNATHVDHVLNQTSQINQNLSYLIIEPVGRNTAPAITLAALSLRQSSQISNCDPIMLVMPSDHMIRNTNKFQHFIRTAFRLANLGYMVTFGIEPTKPHTGYGYIEMGTPIELSLQTSQQAEDMKYLQLSNFKEKPNLQTAKSYLKSGNYLWNSGIFMMKSSVWLSELELYRPDIYSACVKAWQYGHTDEYIKNPSKECFEDCPSESIDYAVMEKASAATLPETKSLVSKCAVIPMKVDWSDLGSWFSIWETGKKDSYGNTLIGNVVADNCNNSLLISTGPHISGLGLDSSVIIATNDGILATKLNVEQ